MYVLFSWRHSLVVAGVAGIRGSGIGRPHKPGPGVERVSKGMTHPVKREGRMLEKYPGNLKREGRAGGVLEKYPGNLKREGRGGGPMEKREGRGVFGRSQVGVKTYNKPSNKDTDTKVKHLPIPPPPPPEYYTPLKYPHPSSSMPFVLHNQVLC